MKRKVGIAFVGIVGVLAAGAGCQPKQTRISPLEPYLGQRPASVRPLKKRQPKVVGGTPSKNLSSDRGWVPARGISKRWQCVVIHHSGSDKSTPQGMRDWHVNGRGWDALGYHFVIGNGVGYTDGAIYVGERWTKQMHGAHCKTPGNHYNNHGIGICLIGNLDGHPPSAKQVQALARLTTFLSRKCGIPRSQVLTHKGVTNKTACPGRRFSLSAVLKRMSPYSVSASSR